MRVLWLSHLVPYPPKGGVLQRSYYLLREAATRHEVDLFALAQPAHQATGEELAAAEEALGGFCREVETYWLRSDRRSWGRTALLAKSFLSSRPYDVNWLSHAPLSSALRERERLYDLVHVDTIGLTPYVKEIGDGVPFVLNHHNIESQMMEDRAKSESNLLKRLYMLREARKLEQWERRWAPIAGVNTVVSPLDRKRLAGRSPQAKIDVVDNGVDTEYFQPMSSPEEHDGYLVFVGGMSWYPNRDAVQWFVNDIWPLLREQSSRRRVVLIGRNPPAEVQKAAQQGSVRAPGFVDDIRPVVDRAMAYICPIRKGGGTRLKVLDALAMAKPLVATSFAVEGLGLQEEKHYLQANSPKDWERQIERLEQFPTLRRRLGEAGRKLVERRFAWGVIGEKLECSYDHLVHNSTN